MGGGAGSPVPTTAITDKEVGLILDRLRSARDPKDRADAVARLQQMGKNDPGRVGRLAVPLVLDLLRARRLGQLDEGTAQGLLELLRELLGHPAPGGGREVLLLLLKDAGNMDALLDMAEGTDTLTTVATLQVVQAALEAGPGEVETVLQSGGSQQGMVRLVACLSDEREEVRNEVLLVLGKLTAGSPSENLKTLVAFNEGFEHLLAMIEDDGGLLEGGGVITHDCLRLLGNVVEATPSTQRHFCELGPLDTLAPWMDVTRIPPPSDEEEEAQQQQGNTSAPLLEYRQIESFRLALRILRNLVAAPPVNKEHDTYERQVQDRQRRQARIVGDQHGTLLRSLVHLATAPFAEEDVANKVQYQALALLGELVDGNAETQQLLLDARVDPSYAYVWPVEDVVRPTDRENGSAYLSAVLLRVALHAPFSFVRAAALTVVYRLLEGNEMACVMMVQHIIAPPLPPLDLPDDDEGWAPASPLGVVLLEELITAITQSLAAGGGEEVEAAQAACFLLEHVLGQGGLAASELATRIPTNLGSDGTDGTDGGDQEGRKLLLDWVTYLLEECVKSPAAGALEGVAVAMLRLLAVWTSGCQAAARQLLCSTANLFLFDLLAKKKASSSTEAVSAHVKTLVAVVLGLCLEYWGDAPDEASGLGRAEVQTMIEHRVGLSGFTGALEGLERMLVPGRNFVGEWPSLEGGTPGGKWPYYDSRFVAFYRQEVKSIRRRLLLMGGGGAGGGNEMHGGEGEDQAAKYLEVIAEQEKEIESLKGRIENVLAEMQQLNQQQQQQQQMETSVYMTPMRASLSALPAEVVFAAGGDGGGGVNLFGNEALESERQLRQAAEASLGEKEGVVQSLQHELAQREARLLALQQEVDQRTAEMAAYVQQQQQQGNGGGDHAAEENATLMAANFQLQGELSTVKDVLAGKEDEVRKLSLELQKATAREKKLGEEKAEAAGRLGDLERELETVSVSYQSLQQELERAHKAMHLENQKLKRAEEENERWAETVARLEKEGQELLLQQQQQQAVAAPPVVVDNALVEQLQAQLLEAQGAAGELPEYQRALEEYRVYSEGIAQQLEEMTAYANGQAQLVADLQQQQQQQAYAAPPPPPQEPQVPYQPQQQQQQQQQDALLHASYGSSAGIPTPPPPFQEQQYTQESDASSLFPPQEGQGMLDASYLFPPATDNDPPSLFPPAAAPSPHDHRIPTPDASSLFGGPPPPQFDTSSSSSFVPPPPTGPRPGEEASFLPPPPPPPASTATRPSPVPQQHEVETLQHRVAQLEHELYQAQAQAKTATEVEQAGQASRQEAEGLQQRLAQTEADLQYAQGQATAAAAEIERISRLQEQERQVAGESEELRQRLVQVESELQHAQSQATAATAEIERLTALQAHERQQAAGVEETLRTEAEEYRKEAVVLQEQGQEKRRAFQAELDELRCQLAAAAAAPPLPPVESTAPLQEELASVRAALADMTQREEALRQEVDALQGQAQEYQAQVEDVLKAKDVRIDEVTYALQGSEQRAEELIQESGRLTAQVRELEAQLKSSGGEKDAEMVALRNEVNRLAQALQVATASEQKALLEYQHVLQDKEQAIAGLQEEVDAFIQARQQQAADTEQLAGAQARIALLEGQVIEANARISEQEGQVASLQTELEATVAAQAALNKASQGEEGEEGPTREELLAALAEREEDARLFDEDRANITSEFQALIAEKRKEADTLAVERHDLLQKLLYAEQVLKEQAGALQSTREELDKTQRAKTERDAALAEIHQRYDALASRRAETAELLEAMATKDADMQQLREHVGELEGQLQQASAGWKGLVEEKEGELQDLQATVRRSKEEQGQLREEFSHAQGTILSLLDAVAVPSPLTSRQATAAAEEGHPPAMAPQPQQQQEYIAHLQSQVQELTEEVSRLLAEQAGLDASNPRLDRDELIDLQHEVDRLAALVVQREQEVSHLGSLEPEIDNLRAEVTRLQGDLQYYQQQEGSTTTATAEFDTLVADLAARLGPIPTYHGHDGAPIQPTASQQLRWYCDLLFQQLEEAQTTVGPKEEALAAATHDVQELRAQLDEANRLKDEEIRAVHADLDELRVALARQGDGEDVGPFASSGASNSSNLVLEGTLMELKALRADYEALRQKHATAQEDATARVERLTDVLEAKEQMVAGVTREHNRLKNEMEFELKLKAGMLQDRDQKLEELSRRAMEQRHVLQQQLEGLEDKLRATEEERDVLTQRLEELVERHGSALKAREKAVADLRQEQDKTCLQHLDRSGGGGGGGGIGTSSGGRRLGEDALARVQDQLATVKRERDHLRQELHEARNAQHEALRKVRRELAQALEANASLQLELNGRELKHQSTRRDYLALQAEVSKNEGLILLQREAEHRLQDREAKIQALEAELGKLTAQRDQLRQKLEETWNRVAAGTLGIPREEEQTGSSRAGRTRRAAAAVGGGHSRTSSSSSRAAAAAAAAEHHHHRQQQQQQQQEDPSLEEDLYFLQTKLVQLKTDLGEERALFKQLEVEHQVLLEELGDREMQQHGHLHYLEHSHDGSQSHDEFGGGFTHHHHHRQRHEADVEDDAIYYQQRQPDLV